MNEKYKNVFLMFTRMSFARGDYAGLMTHLLTYRRILEMVDILTGGTDSRWWLSTRLLLGLSHDDAVQMGKDLAEWRSEPNASVMRLGGLGLTIA